MRERRHEQANTRGSTPECTWSHMHGPLRTSLGNMDASLEPEAVNLPRAGRFLPSPHQTNDDRQDSQKEGVQENVFKPHIYTQNILWSNMLLVIGPCHAERKNNTSAANDLQILTYLLGSESHRAEWCSYYQLSVHVMNHTFLPRMVSPLITELLHSTQYCIVVGREVKKAPSC